jgi:hypothetical protein
LYFFGENGWTQGNGTKASLAGGRLRLLLNKRASTMPNQHEEKLEFQLILLIFLIGFIEIRQEFAVIVKCF